MCSVIKTLLIVSLMAAGLMARGEAAEDTAESDSLRQGVEQTTSEAGPSGIDLARLKIKRFQQLTVQRTDSSFVQGSLIRFNSGTSMVDIYVRDSGATSVESVPFQEISYITYRERGRLRPLFLVLGLVVGNLAGQAVEGLVDPGGWSGFESYPFGNGYWRNDSGAKIGMAAGVVAGVVLSLLIRGDVTIRCR